MERHPPKQEGRRYREYRQFLTKEVTSIVAENTTKENEFYLKKQITEGGMVLAELQE